MTDLTLLLKAKDEASKVINGVKGNLGKIKDQANKVADNLQKVGGDIAKFGAGVAVVGGLMLAPFITAVPVFADFDDAMRGVQARAEVTETSIDELRDQAKKLGSETAHSAKDVASGMGFLAQAGWDTAQIFEGIPHILDLASASNTDLARTADIASNVISGYALDVEKDSQRVADVLAKTTNASNTNLEQLGEAFKYAGPLASAAGWEFENTAAALGILANAGVQGSSAGTGLNQIIARLSDTSSKSSRKLEEMGISALDSAGNLRPLDHILGDLENAGASVSDTLDIFGLVAGPKLQAMINQGTASLQDLMVDLGDSEGAAKKTAEEMEAGLGGGMRQVRSAIEGVQIELGEALAPVLMDIIPIVQDLALRFIQFIKDNPGIIKAFAGVGAVLLVLGTILTTVGGFLIFLGTAIKGAIAIFGFLAGVVKVIIVIFKIVAAVIAFLTIPIGLVVLAVGALIAIGVLLWKNWNNITEWMGKAWGSLSGKAIEGVEKMKSGFETGLNFVKGLFENIFGGIEKVVAGTIGRITDQIDKVKNLAGGVGDFVKGGLSKIPGFAVGTRHHTGGIALVGERGPELVNMPAGSKVDTATATERKTSQGGGNNITFAPILNFNSLEAPSGAKAKEMYDNLKDVFENFVRDYNLKSI